MEKQNGMNSLTRTVNWVRHLPVKQYVIVLVMWEVLIFNVQLCTVSRVMSNPRNNL